VTTVSGEDLTVYEHLVTKLKTEIEQRNITHLKEKGRGKMAGSKEQRAGGKMNLRISPPPRQL